MTIIKDGRNSNPKKEFVIVGVGGAGSKSAAEMSKILGNPDDVIVVDRDEDALRSINAGRRISIGYPIFVSDCQSDDNLVDANDLFRLKAVIGKASIVFVMAGLGGATTMELVPSVIRTAMSTGASVLATFTLPFAFEGPNRADTASLALDRIRATGCSIALIDADNTLSNVAAAGNLATELSAAKAKVVMNVLSASSAPTFGTLNTATDLLDAIKGGGETFISYASTDDAVDFRKVAKQAVKAPITSGLDIQDADYVSVIIAGPRDMSIKSLNTAISIVQAEMSSEAALSTSFIPNSDPAKSDRLRISILAGRRQVPQAEVANVEGEIRTADHVELAIAGANSRVELDVASTDEDDLFGAPDWLLDSAQERTAVPAMI